MSFKMTPTIQVEVRDDEALAIRIADWIAQTGIKTESRLLSGAEAVVYHFTFNYHDAPLVYDFMAVPMPALFHYAGDGQGNPPSVHSTESRST